MSVQFSDFFFGEVFDKVFGARGGGGGDGGSGGGGRRFLLFLGGRLGGHRKRRLMGSIRRHPLGVELHAEAGLDVFARAADFGARLLEFPRRTGA